MARERNLSEDDGFERKEYPLLTTDEWYEAQLLHLIDMGSHWKDTKPGLPQKLVRVYKVVFELTNDILPGHDKNAPYTLQEDMTVSVDGKTGAHFAFGTAKIYTAFKNAYGLEGIKQGDRVKLPVGEIEDMIGKPCRLMVENRVSKSNGKTYQNIKMLTQAKPGAKIPPAFNKSINFLLGEEPAAHMYKSWREKINACKEVQDGVVQPLEIPDKIPSAFVDSQQAAPATNTETPQAPAAADEFSDDDEVSF